VDGGPSFEPFAQAMPEWRVVSMDQRGRGLSDHQAEQFNRAVRRFIEKLD
jgi:pimeloyl-ACP methyl ester carboxylesterase